MEPLMDEIKYDMEIHTFHDTVKRSVCKRLVEPENPLYPIARAELDDVFENYDLPFDRNDVAIAIIEADGGLWGACAPVACGRYITGENTWQIEKQPKGYIIMLNERMFRSRHDPMNRIIRHELAHAADWHESLYTTEKTEGHEEWLDKLDSY